MKVPFHKMSGAGNDFVVVDWRDGRKGIPWSDFAPGMCDRRAGIGADGLIVISDAGEADFSMEYFNADGSSGSLCGNGARCAARYMSDQLGKGEVTFTTCGRRYRAVARDGLISLDMQDPIRLQLDMQLRTDRGTTLGHFIDTGAPHLVVLVDGSVPVKMHGDGSDDEILSLGRQLRHHPEFSDTGANVDFVLIEEDDALRVRTYEKGVENETLACGTGAVASSAIYSIIRGREGYNSIKVIPKSGDLLTVSFERSGTSLSHVCLEGPAVVIFSGVYETRD